MMHDNVCRDVRAVLEKWRGKSIQTGLLARTVVNKPEYLNCSGRRKYAEIWRYCKKRRTVRRMYRMGWMTKPKLRNFVFEHVANWLAKAERDRDEGSMLADVRWRMLFMVFHNVSMIVWWRLDHWRVIVFCCKDIRLWYQIAKYFHGYINVFGCISVRVFVLMRCV